MKAAINKLNTKDEYFFDEGCYIIEVSNSDNDNDVSIARARVEPGVTTKWHKLSGTTERYVIIEGIGLVEIGDMKPTNVSAGDVVVIPEQTPQRITNTGTTDLVFLAVCSPRFKRNNYYALGSSGD